MNDELYHLWMQRANAEAPADFADRVMDAVRREPLPSSKGARILLLSSPAVRVAACPQAAGKGVLVVLNNQILAARDAIKTSTSRLETFKSNELGVLGYAELLETQVLGPIVEKQQEALKRIQSVFAMPG